MYKTIFIIIYGRVLRVSEAVALKIEDIDSRKMRIFVRAGKDRDTVLSKQFRNIKKILPNVHYQKIDKDISNIILNTSNQKLKKKLVNVQQI